MTASVLTAVDLCCGAGGWACAGRGLPIRWVAAVDRWDRCCETYRHNVPGAVVIEGDLRQPDTRTAILEAAAGVDLVCGAIPCEWLTAMRRGANKVQPHEVEEGRATLAAVLELVSAIDPAWWCLEDVRELGPELPSGTPCVELNSADYSAQRRRRIYVGQFPPPIMRRCDLVMGDKLRPGPYRINHGSRDRQVGRSTTMGPGTIYGTGATEKSPTVRDWSSRRDRDYVVVGPDIRGGRRQLEWQEAAALQGFPANFVFVGNPGDVWKMIGQAVQIDTAAAILREIVKAWKPWWGDCP